MPRVRLNADTADLMTVESRYRRILGQREQNSARGPTACRDESVRRVPVHGNGVCRVGKWPAVYLSESWTIGVHSRL